jgi:hypothetical protein
MSSRRATPPPNADRYERDQTDPFGDLPDDSADAGEDSDWDDFDRPCTDAEDDRWDVFIADDDERDPLPDAGDFWNDEFRNGEFPNDE